MDLSLLTLVALLSLPALSRAILGKAEGESCESLDGSRGSCRLLSQCDYPGDFRKDHPPICSFRYKEPIICCPLPLDVRLHAQGSKLQEYCANVNRDCLEREAREEDNEITRHVIGEEAPPRTHIHMALIGYGPADTKSWECGGSLINSRFILSAAHCAVLFQIGAARWAILGDLDISSDSDDAKIQEREIVERVIHPEYKETEVYNDIALFKLDKDIEFTPWVGPACLYTEKSILATSAIVTGWGRVDFSGPQSPKLREAEIDIFGARECSGFYPEKNRRTPRGIDSELQMCAGKVDGSKDACPGDSGGPLVLNETSQCLKTQIGVVSFGDQCGLSDSPGVYTKVYPYLAWIEDMAFSAEALDGLYFSP